MKTAVIEKISTEVLKKLIYRGGRRCQAGRGRHRPDQQHDPGAPDGGTSPASSSSTSPSSASAPRWAHTCQRRRAVPHQSGAAAALRDRQRRGGDLRQRHGVRRDAHQAQEGAGGDGQPALHPVLDAGEEGLREPGRGGRLRQGRAATWSGRRPWPPGADTVEVLVDNHRKEAQAWTRAGAATSCWS